MAHRYNLRSAKKAAGTLEALQHTVQTLYQDSDRITVTLSDTGKGQHLRWRQSEPPEDIAAGSPHEVDEDGDSVMGGDDDDDDADSDSEMSDDSQDSVRPGSLVRRLVHMRSISSDRSVLLDDDGNVVQVFFDRYGTPLCEEPYDPGSVINTPKKKPAALGRSPRVGGDGIDWWHDGADTRVVFGERDGPLADSSRRTSSLDDDTRYIRDALAQRGVKTRRNPPAAQGPSSKKAPARRPGSKAKAPPAQASDSGSDDSDSETVKDFHEDDAPPPSGAPRLPYVRPLPGPAPPAQEQAQTASTVCMHFFRDKDGTWAREGSIPPDSPYKLDRTKLPVRRKYVPEEVELSSPLSRSDTWPAFPS